MNEINSKIVEYTLVILIGLIISYVVFVQLENVKNRLDQFDQKIREVEQKIESLKTDMVVRDLKIKRLDEQLNPKPTETTIDEKSSDTEKEEANTIKPE
ncbi:MAG: hypothetical protein PHR47_02270 [Candidatus Pacebacteria bacterium]|nr:hypothetical protein [Candidatus Paceibacterota bacterium]